jgi:hypothetical protein
LPGAAGAKVPERLFGLAIGSGRPFAGGSCAVLDTGETPGKAPGRGGGSSTLLESGDTPGKASTGGNCALLATGEPLGKPAGAAGTEPLG